MSVPQAPVVGGVQPERGDGSAKQKYPPAASSHGARQVWLPQQGGAEEELLDELVVGGTHAMPVGRQNPAVRLTTERMQSANIERSAMLGKEGALRFGRSKVNRG